MTTLASFNGTNGASPGPIIFGSDGNLYGTTAHGTPADMGIVYQITTNGILTSLASFAGANGGVPVAALAQGGDGNFYGTAVEGGSDGQGVIFRVRSGAYLRSILNTSNGIQLNVLNVGGSGKVILESSPDLVNWHRIQTNGPGGPIQFLDPAASGHSRQFYRVVQK